MFYIIEIDNGQFLTVFDNDSFAESTKEQATVFNQHDLNKLLKLYEKEGEIFSFNCDPINFAYIHALGSETKYSYADFVSTFYNQGDIIDFDGNLYEVEGVKNGEVQLSHEDGCDFSVEFEYVKLVCKAKDRKDK